MKYKKLIATLMLSTSILGISSSLTTHAAENNAPNNQQQASQNNIVNIPDTNLKKALNEKLGQAESAAITTDQLASITTLKVSNKNIHSIEGLQYCKNLKNLDLGYGYSLSADTANEISDLTPLQNLTNLSVLHAGNLTATNFSPLKNLNLKMSLLGSFWGHQHINKDVETNPDGSYTLKNDCISKDGSVMEPSDTDGGVYDKGTNTITWSKETIANKRGHNDVCYLKPVFSDPAEKDFDGGQTVLMQLSISQIKQALREVYALFLNNDPNTNKLAADVSQESIDRAKSDVDVLQQGNVKKNLLKLIERAQLLLDTQQTSTPEIKDANLKAAINQQLGKASDYNPTKDELKTVTKIAAPFKEIKDLSGLENCTNLEILDLNGDQYSDLTPIKGLTQLAWLNISNNKNYTDISPLSGLTNLNKLYAAYTNIKDLSVFSNLPRLSVLDVPYSKVTNLTGVEGCANLTELDLNGDQYSDLNPIKNLTNISWLNIANNKEYTDISALKNLSNLTKLFADYTNIKDLSALENASQLSILHIPYSQITSLKPLEGCTNLTELDLNGDQYSNLIPLKNLTKINWLNIANNKQLSDISSLSNLKNVTSLYADNDSITDISVLSNMQHLKSLHIPNNPIKDYSPLNSLKELTDLIK